MSIRTIIEINHDYIGSRGDVREALEALVARLPYTGVEELKEQLHHFFNGVRILGQRHHANKITLVVD